MKLREWCTLLACRFSYSFSSLAQYLKEIHRYYSNSLFRKCDLYLLRHYLSNSPYEISKSFHLEKGAKDPYLYGETPLTTLEEIANECGIDENDCFFELGAGRGRACFWMRLFKKCRVVGIEQVAEFVQIARNVVEAYSLDDISFVHGDFLNMDLSAATIIYFYGTCSDEVSIQRLIDQCQRLKTGARVITISYPLSSYGDAPPLQLEKTLTVRFPWGTTEAYIQKKGH